MIRSGTCIDAQLLQLFNDIKFFHLIIHLLLDLLPAAQAELTDSGRGLEMREIGETCYAGAPICK